MSVRIGTATIQAKDYLDLEEIVSNLEERLIFHGKKHKDFSCVIEKHLDSNQVIVKTLYLEEYAN